MPILYWGVGFWDYGYWVDRIETSISEEAIHSILFPNISFEYVEYCHQNKLSADDERVASKWKNAKCDVQAFWSHAHHKRDIFVTSDRNFMAATKRPRLVALAGGNIETPAFAAGRLNK